MTHPAGPASGGGLRILIVDDQHLVRTGFAMMLDVEDDLDVVGDAADGAAAIARARELRPDVVLMDVQMPGVDGIEATRAIVAEGLARVIILTTFDRDDYLFDGLRAGASGFLLKNTDPDDLADAIRAVGHGHALLAPEVTRRVIESVTAAPPAGATTMHGPADDPERRDVAGSALPEAARAALAAGGLDRLTAREREVLTLVGRGRSNAEIAAELVVGEATVKTHVSSVLAKLGLRDRVQAVVAAYETGMICPGG